MNKDRFIYKQSKFLKDSLSFTLWDKFKVDAPLFKFNLEKFLNNFTVKDPSSLSPNYLWILNNCNNGKKQHNYECPQVVFVDIDFHCKYDKSILINKFLKDVDCKDQFDFLKKISKDEYCLLGGLSKSGLGIRLIFLVQTQYSMYCHFEEGFFTTTDQNIKIHKDNWYYVMKYLNINYGIDINEDCEYSMKDRSASGIQQGTYFIRKENSFKNVDCKWLFNPYIEKDDIEGNTNQSTYDTIIESDWNYDNLNKLYNDNFKSSLKSWEPYIKLLEYVLPYYVNKEGNVIEFFYDKLNEVYEGSSRIHKYGLSNFKNHYNNKNVKHMSLDIWLRMIGIPVIIKNNNNL